MSASDYLQLLSPFIPLTPLSPYPTLPIRLIGLIRTETEQQIHFTLRYLEIATPPLHSSSEG